MANKWEYVSLPPGDINPPPSPPPIPPMSSMLLKRKYSLLIWQLYHCNATSVQTQLGRLEYQSVIVTVWWRKRAMRYLTDAWPWITIAHFWSSNLLRQRTVLVVSYGTRSSISVVSAPVLTTSCRMFCSLCMYIAFAFQPCIERIFLYINIKGQIWCKWGESK